ncbi:MAG: VOC family protein [Candidatus Wallbacteria bacterium]|nr:VOC family protein [Candidatus Wallbacteria bacterium]
MKFHHFGIAVKSIAEGRALVESLFGAAVNCVIVRDADGLELCLLTTEGGATMELISGKQVERFWKDGVYLYHACYQTGNFEQDLEKLQKNGGTVMKQTQHSALFGNRRLAFVFTEIGIIELLESGAEKD